MVCPTCKAENSNNRSHCWRCGASLRTTSGTNSEPATPAEGIRFTVLLPIYLIVGLSVCAGLWWKINQMRQAHAAAAEQEKSQSEAAKLAEATARVALVNAQASDCLRSGNFAAGLKIVDEVLALVDSPELTETKVNLLMKSGRNHEAYELLLVLLPKQSEAAHLHFLAGTLAATVKNPNVAMSHFGDAYRLAPDNKAYQVAWAKTCLLAGLRDPAVATFNKLLADDPQCAPCWLDVAGAYYASGQSQEAVSLMQQALKRFPSNPAYHFTLGRILDEIGTTTADSEKLRIAASYYRKSLELQPRKNSVAAKRYYEITHTQVPSQLEAIRSDEIRLERRGASYFVQASINGVPGNFILDTGASVTAIAAGSLQRFKIVPSSQTARMTTANGSVQAALAYADIDLGQHTVHQALISVLPQGVGADCDGLFGLDSMRRLGAQLDTVRGCLVVRDDQTETAN